MDILKKRSKNKLDRKLEFGISSDHVAFVTFPREIYLYSINVFLYV